MTLTIIVIAMSFVFLAVRIFALIVGREKMYATIRLSLDSSVADYEVDKSSVVYSNESILRRAAGGCLKLDGTFYVDSNTTTITKDALIRREACRVDNKLTNIPLLYECISIIFVVVITAYVTIAGVSFFEFVGVLATLVFLKRHTYSILSALIELRCDESLYCKSDKNVYGAYLVNNSVPKGYFADELQEIRLAKLLK